MQLAHFPVDHLTELVDVLLLLRRYEETLVVQLRHPCAAQLVEGDVFLGCRSEVVLLLFGPRIVVYLVEDYHGRLVGTSEVLERVLHHVYLFLEVGVRYVDDVEQEVCLAHLVQRRLKRVNQVCGQLADKAYGVGKEERQILHHHFPDRGVQRGEELVLGEHLTLREEVHDGRLAHVGVSHECHTNEATAVLALRGLLLVNLKEALLEQRDAVEDDTAVHLELGLTRSAQTHTTLSATRTGASALTLEVSPEALQSGQHIAILRQLHLRFGCRCLGTHGEDVKDERGAVQYLHAQHLLYVSYLLGRKLVVEDNHTHGAFGVFLISDVLTNLLQLS